jgi:hypothetical protein
MNIYVYQTGIDQYHASFSANGGRVVEVWPVNSEKEINYVASNGSAFGGVKRDVQMLAERAKSILIENGAYTQEQQKDLFSQKELQERSELLDIKERQLQKRGERQDEQQMNLTVQEGIIADLMNSVKAREDEIFEQNTHIDDRFEALNTREKLLEACRQQLNQREFSLENDEEKVRKQQKKDAIERDKALRFIESREIDIRDRENRLKGINSLSLWDKLKLFKGI